MPSNNTGSMDPGNGNRRNRRQPEIESQSTVDLDIAKINEEENLKAIAKISDALLDSVKDYEVALKKTLDKATEAFSKGIDKAFDAIDRRTAKMFDDIRDAADYEPPVRPRRRSGRDDIPTVANPNGSRSNTSYSDREDERWWDEHIRNIKHQEEEERKLFDQQMAVRRKQVQYANASAADRQIMDLTDAKDAINDEIKETIEQLAVALQTPELADEVDMLRDNLKGLADSLEEAESNIDDANRRKNEVTIGKDIKKAFTDGSDKLVKSMSAALTDWLFKFYDRMKQGVQNITGVYESTYSNVSVLMDQNQRQYMAWQSNVMSDLKAYGLDNNIAISEIMTKLDEVTKQGITGQRAQNKAFADVITSKIAPFIDTNSDTYTMLQMQGSRMIDTLNGLGGSLNEQVGQSRFFAKNIDSMLGEVEDIATYQRSEQFDKQFANVAAQIEAAVSRGELSMGDATKLKDTIMQTLNDPFSQVTSGNALAVSTVTNTADLNDPMSIMKGMEASLNQLFGGIESDALGYSAMANILGNGMSRFGVQSIAENGIYFNDANAINAANSAAATADELEKALASDKFTTALAQKNIQAENNALGAAQFAQLYPDAYSAIVQIADTTQNILATVIGIAAEYGIRAVGRGAMGLAKNALGIGGETAAASAGGSGATAALSGAVLPGLAIAGGVAGAASAGYGIYQIATAGDLDDGTAKSKHDADLQRARGITKVASVGVGAGAGAAIGSVIPGLGTLIGAGLGAGIGAIVGGIASAIEDSKWEKATERLEDMTKEVSNLNDVAKASLESARQTDELKERYIELSRELSGLDEGTGEYASTAQELQSVIDILNSKYSDLDLTIEDSIDGYDEGLKAIEKMTEAERNLAIERSKAAISELKNSSGDINNRGWEYAQANNEAQNRANSYNLLKDYSDLLAATDEDLTFDNKSGKIDYSGSDEEVKKAVEYMNKWGIHDYNNLGLDYSGDGVTTGVVNKKYNIEQMISNVANRESNDIAKAGLNILETAETTKNQLEQFKSGDEISQMYDTYHNLYSALGLTPDNIDEVMKSATDADRARYAGILQDMRNTVDTVDGSYWTEDFRKEYEGFRDIVNKYDGIKNILAIGQSYIPEEGNYILHPEEAVLNAKEAKEYRKVMGVIPSIASFIDKIAGRTDDQTDSGNTEIVSSIDSNTNRLIDAINNLISVVNNLGSATKMNSPISTESNRPAYIGTRASRIGDSYKNLSRNPSLSNI